MADHDEVMRDDDIASNKRRRGRSRSPDDGRPKRRRSASPRGRGGDNWHGSGFRSDGYYDDYGGNQYWGGGNDRYDSRGSYGAQSRVPDPQKVDYLVSFKHFSDWTRERGGRRMDEEEIRKRYDLYKEEFRRDEATKFYNQHMNDEWFYEKYNTAKSGPFRSKVKERKEEVYRIFKEDLEAGQFDNISFDQVIQPPDMSKRITNDPATVKQNGDSSTHNLDDELNDALDDKPEQEPENAIMKDAVTTGTTATPTLAIASSTWPDVQVADPRVGSSVFIRSVPGNFKRAEIEEVLKTYPGFKCLELSDPNSQKRFSRFGWVVLKEGFDPEEAVKFLSNKKIVKLPTDLVESGPPQPPPITEFLLQVNVATARTNKPRVIPIETNNLKRMDEDVKIAHDLAKEMDGEVGWKPEDGEGATIVISRLAVILGPESDESDEESRLSRVKKDLDLHIEYLKRVHFYDFYSCIECDSPEDFLRRVPVSLRQAPQPNSNPEAPTLQRFLERMDVRHHHRIHKPFESDMIKAAGGKDIEIEIDKSMNSYIGKVDDGKFRCLLCTKLFKGEEFVRKHIRTKHPSLVDQLRSAFVVINNYCRDPNRVHDMPPEPAPRFMAPPTHSNQYWDAPNSGIESGGGGGFFDQAYSGGPPSRGSLYPRGSMRGRFMDGGRGRGRGRGRGIPMEFGAPPPPPAGAYVDPRQRMSYVDLDAPAVGGPEVDTISYD